MATNFNKTNKYTATNVRDSHDTREVRFVAYSAANGYMFEDVTDGFTFNCKYANVGPITGHIQVAGRIQVIKSIQAVYTEEGMYISCLCGTWRIRCQMQFMGSASVAKIPRVS